jgi:polyhydroxybutyrate depolymerase
MLIGLKGMIAMLKSNLLSIRTGADNMHLANGTVAMIRFSLATFAFLGTLRLAVGDIVVGGDRPVKVQTPSGYDPEVPAPLLLELHGGKGPPSLLDFNEPAKHAGFLYAAPTGDTGGCLPSLPPGWNPKYTFCERWTKCPDDSAYLREVIDSTMLQLAVDPQRIYVVGRSLGGMMTLRMACDHADVLAGIVNFDGPWGIADQREPCVPSAPVHTLHICGTGNKIVRAGQITIGSLSECPDPLFHIGSAVIAEEWAGYNGCSLDTQEGLPLDLVTTLPGDDTLVTRYAECAHGGQVELWEIVGADHHPSWTSEFYTNVLDWLLEHPKGSVSIKPIEVDFNGDYIINIDDLVVLIEHWGQNEPSVDIAPAPFGDGVVDAADLEALMSHWGQEIYDPNFITH